MFNSTVVANINGSLPTGQKVSGGLPSSMLLPMNFSKTDVKKTSVTQDQRTTFPKPAAKSATNMIFNGQAKRNCTLLDQNKNPQSKQMKLVNGNKNSGETDDGVPVAKVWLYPGKIVAEWQQSHKIGAGLVNLGNTCFMNTVLQCLTYCPPLANYLLHDSDHASKCRTTGFCMMCELQRHMKRAICRAGDPIKPVNVYHKLQHIAKHFQFGRQEDAHEFLRYVIDHLWKACLTNYDGYAKLDPASKETTVINQIFGGYHRSQVTCLRCKEKSNTYDHFMDLMLDIKNVFTLEKALEKFIQPELLQNENAYKCPQCKMKVSAQKKFTVYKAPNVATLQFKRFDYHRMCGKITKHIAYPESLNMRPYMSIPKGAPVTYRLNAVLVHCGQSCNTGHYFCYVKNSNGLWYVMDDARVQQVSLNQVLNQNAYVLFYVRVNPESGIVKKPLENTTANVRNNHVLKNGFVGAGSASPNSHMHPNAKSAAVSTISKLAESPQPNGFPNGMSAKQKQVLQPMSQKRNKVVFTVGAPSNAAAKENSVRKLESNYVKTASPRPVLNGNTLVPYMEDSSEDVSEDEEAKVGDHDRESSQSESVKNMTVARDALNGEKPVKNTGLFKPLLTNQGNRLSQLSKDVNQNKEKAAVIKPEISLANGPMPLKEKIVENSSLVDKEKQSKTITSLSSLNPLSSPSLSASSVKVNATSSWNVVEMSHHSPSVASGSSTNSVNSTTDWNIIDQDSKRKNERSSLSSSAMQAFKNRERNQKIGTKIRNSAEVKIINVKACSDNDRETGKPNGATVLSDPVSSEPKPPKCDKLKPDSDSAVLSALSKSPVTASAPNLTSVELDHKSSAESGSLQKTPEHNPPAETPPPTDSHKEPKQPFRNMSFQSLRTNAFLQSYSNKGQGTAPCRDTEAKKQSSLKRSFNNVVEDASAKWPSRFPDPDEDSSVPVSKKFKADLDHSIPKSERKHPFVVEIADDTSSIGNSKQGVSNSQISDNESGQSDSRKHSVNVSKAKDSEMKNQPAPRIPLVDSKERASPDSYQVPTSFYPRTSKFCRNFGKYKHVKSFTSNHLITDDTSDDGDNNQLASQTNIRTHSDLTISSAASRDFPRSLYDKNDSWQGSGKNHQTSFTKADRTCEYKKEDNANSDSSSSSYGSKGRFEYSWVERTKETIDREYKSKASPNVWSVNPECKKKPNHDSWFNCLSNRGKNSNVVTELQRKPNNLFGSDVGSWNNCRRSPEPESRARNCFDDYDEELDRGKMKQKKKHRQDMNHYDYNPFETFVQNRKRNDMRFNDGCRRQKYHQKRYRYHERYYGRPYKNGGRYFSKPHHERSYHVYRH